MKPTFEIKQATFATVGPTRTQYYRPYEVVASSDDVEQWRELFKEPRLAFFPSDITPIARRILQPNLTVEEPVPIPGGWDQPRFRFMLVLREPASTYFPIEMEHVYYGYTDHCNIAEHNQLDDNMRLYFNRNIVNILGTDDICGTQLVDTRVHGEKSNQNVLYLLSHIFGAALGREVASELWPGEHITTLLAHDPMVLVDTDNAIPSNYLTALANGILSTKEEYDDVGERTAKDFYESIAEHTAEKKAKSNPLYRLLDTEVGFFERGYVTLADMKKIFPEFEDCSQFSVHEENAMESEPWDGRDDYSEVAHLVTHAVPAVMMDCGIRYADLYVKIENSVNEVVLGIDSYETKDAFMKEERSSLDHRIGVFKQRLIKEVFADVFKGKEVGIHVKANLVGMTVIDISINGGQHRRFVAPSYADGLFSPVISTIDNAAMMMDIEQLINV